MRRVRRILLVASSVALVLTPPVPAKSDPAALVRRPLATAQVVRAEQGPAVAPGRSGPARSLPLTTNDPGIVVEEGVGAGGAPTDPTTNRPPSVQPRSGVAAEMHGGLDAPIIQFAGQNGATPPDTVGDVGPSHYVQMVNTTFQIWNKQGTSLAGPSAINSLWTSNVVDDGKCDTQNAGDPIVLYDQAADRWMLSQFSSPNSGAPFLMCIAYSQTPDPTAAYFTYAFVLNDSNDYMKFGIWPDGLYMSVFEGGGENGAYVFDRTTMLAGGAATFQYFGGITDGAQPRGMRILPSDWDGTITPPAGAPNYFVQSVDGAFDATADRLEVFEAHVDWAVPANSTFTNVTDLATNPFSIDLGCTDDDGDGAFRNCVPQPGTTNRVDNIANRLMHRLQYRNFGTHEAMVVNQTIDDGADRHVVRWYELRKIGAGAWTIFQQGTYGPGTAHRWMGSMAMDKVGNIALGYSLSDPANGVFPSILYTGRQPGAPLGQLTEPELTLFSGTTSQTNADRWGDYSSMNVDPSDDCTFWYTQQHSGNRATRIGAFRFESCPIAPLAICAANPGPGAIPIGYNVIVGTPGPDNLLGTPGDDAIFGGGGIDQILAQGGDDLVFGGDGNDKLHGVDGDDTLCGGAGNDNLLGWNGDDTLSGGDGDDEINGSAGNDQLAGDGGNDKLFGAEGDDALDGGIGVNQNNGGPGTDTCVNGSNVNCAP